MGRTWEVLAYQGKRCWEGSMEPDRVAQIQFKVNSMFNVPFDSPVQSEKDKKLNTQHPILPIITLRCPKVIMIVGFPLTSSHTRAGKKKWPQ